MSWKRRVLQFILCVAMMLVICPTVLHAEEDREVVEVSTFDEFKAALEEDSDTKIVVTAEIDYEDAHTYSPQEDLYCEGICVNIKDPFIILVRGHHILDLNGKKVRVRPYALKFLAGLFDWDTLDQYIGRELYLLKLDGNCTLVIEDSSTEQTGQLEFHGYINKYDTSYMYQATYYRGGYNGSNRFLSNDTYRSLFYLDGNAELTIKSGNYVAGRSKKAWVTDGHIVDVLDYEGKLNGYAYYVIGGRIAKCDGEGKLVIEGGNFTGRKDLLFYVSPQASITIYDGTFDNRTNGRILYNIESNNKHVYGGTFRTGKYDYLIEWKDHIHEFVNPGQVWSIRQEFENSIDWTLCNVKVNGKTYTTCEEFKEKASFSDDEQKLYVVPKDEEQLQGTNTIHDAILDLIIPGVSVQEEQANLPRGMEASIGVAVRSADFYRFPEEANATITYEWYLSENGGEYTRLIGRDLDTIASTDTIAYQGDTFYFNKQAAGSEWTFKVRVIESLGKVKYIHEGELQLTILPEVKAEKVELSLNGPLENGKLVSGTKFSDYQFAIQTRGLKISDVIWGDPYTGIAAGETVEEGKKYIAYVYVRAEDGYYFEPYNVSELENAVSTSVAAYDDESERCTYAFYAFEICADGNVVYNLGINLDSMFFDEDNLLIPGVSLGDYFFEAEQTNLNLNIEPTYWYYNGKTVAMADTVKSLRTYKALLKIQLDAESDYIFDSNMIVTTNGRQAELVGISADGKEAYVYTASYAANCEHMASVWETNETSHWQYCELCGDEINMGEHKFVITRRTAVYAYLTCSECGLETERYTGSGSTPIKEIKVDIPAPVVGNIIGNVTVNAESEEKAELVTVIWTKGSATGTEVTPGLSKFEKSVDYYVKIKVKAKDGYCLTTRGDHTYVTNTGLYIKDASFGSDDYFQNYDAESGMIEVLVHQAAQEEASAELTMPTLKAGMTYGEVIKQFCLTNTSLGTFKIYKDGAIDTTGSFGIVGSNTSSSFSKDYANGADTVVEDGHNYTLAFTMSYCNGYYIPADKVTVKSQGSATSISITDGAKGPFVVGAYSAEGDEKQVTCVTITIQPPFDGKTPSMPTTNTEGVYFSSATWTNEANDIIWSTINDVSNSRFVGGEQYRVIIAIRAKEGYRISEDTLLLVNGVACEKFDWDPEFNILYVQYFDIADKNDIFETIDEGELDVKEPVLNQGAQTVKTPENVPYTVTNCSWTPDTTAQQTNTPYTVYVTLKANEGYLFGSCPDILIKETGQRMTVVSGAGTDVLNLSYTYDSLMGIVSQPADITVTQGEQASFRVTVSGTDMTVYQWQYRNAGETEWHNSGLSSAKTYLFKFNVNTDKKLDGREYRCVIMNSDGTRELVSDAATLHVNYYPTITSQPVDVTAKVGENAKFCVVATGDGLTYQWQYRNAGANGWSTSKSSEAKKATFAFKVNEEPTLNGREYRCKITTAAGLVKYSNVVTLTVEKTASGPVINSNPSDYSAKIGKEASFKVEATGDTLNYRWQYRNAGVDKWSYSKATAAKDSEFKFTVTDDKTLNGREYRCEITDKNGAVVYSEAATLTVEAEVAEPVITKQPENATAKKDEKVTFKVEATGDGLTYQWQYRNVGVDNWSNSKITPAKTKEFYFNVGDDANLNGRQYRCQITDKNGTVVYTKIVTLTVEAEAIALEITKQPVSVSAAKGDKVVFAVEATGDTISYQWEFKNVGATKFTPSGITAAKSAEMKFVVNDDATLNGREYRCKITDKNGEVVYSDVVTLTVKTEVTGPVITSQPVDVSVSVGKPVSFKVVADGDSLSYQWEFKNVGATKFTPSGITAAKTADMHFNATDDPTLNGRQYRCKITDKSGNVVYSNAATLTVTE